MYIFLPVLACHLLVAIEKRFLDRGVHTAWWTLRRQLSTHQLVKVALLTANGRVLKLRKARRWNRFMAPSSQDQVSRDDPGISGNHRGRKSSELNLALQLFQSAIQQADIRCQLLDLRVGQVNFLP